MLPIKRKPAVGETAGFQNLERLAAKFDTQEDSPNINHLQAVRLRNRFAMSWSAARLVASLAYGEVRP